MGHFLRAFHMHRTGRAHRGGEDDFPPFPYAVPQQSPNWGRSLEPICASGGTQPRRSSSEPHRHPNLIQPCTGSCAERRARAAWWLQVTTENKPGLHRSSTSTTNGFKLLFHSRIGSLDSPSARDRQLTFSHPFVLEVRCN